MSASVSPDKKRLVKIKPRQPSVEHTQSYLAPPDPAEETARQSRKKWNPYAKISPRRSLSPINRTDMVSWSASPLCKQVRDLQKSFKPIHKREKSYTIDEGTTDMSSSIALLRDTDRLHNAVVHQMNSLRYVKEELNATNLQINKKLNNWKIEASMTHKRSQSEVDYKSLHKNPFAKRVAPSTYNASKNPFSIDYNCAQAEIKSGVEQCENFAKVAMPNYQKQISREIRQCFASLLSSEFSGKLQVGLDFLQLIQNMMYSQHQSARGIYSLDKSGQGALAKIHLRLQAQISEKQDPTYHESYEKLMNDLGRVSQILRHCLQLVPDPYTVLALDNCWKSSLLTLDSVLNTQNRKLAEAVRNEQITKAKELEETRSQTTGLVSECEKKIYKSKSKNHKLRATIERLQNEKLKQESQLKKKDDKIKELCKAPESGDLDTLMTELIDFLDETERRQSEQATMLSQIGDMINHEWKDPTPPPVVEKPPTPKKPPRRKRKAKRPEPIEEEKPSSPEPAKLVGQMKKVGPDPLEEAEKKNRQLENEVDRMNTQMFRLRAALEDAERRQNQSSDAPKVPIVPFKMMEDRGMQAGYIPFMMTRPISPINVEPEKKWEKEVAFLDALEFDTRDYPQTPGSPKPVQKKSRAKLKAKTTIEPKRKAQEESPIAAERKQTQKYFEASKNANKIDIKEIANQVPSNIPAMRDNNVFKLFESLMDEKFKEDKEYAREGKQPREMVDYMQDFMSMKFGLKAVAAKNSASFIKGLDSLSKREHNYGTLFCSLLHISTENPLDMNITVFMTKARGLFVEVMTKLGRMKLTKEADEYGGSLPFFEIVDLIPKLFGNDMQSGEVFMANIKTMAMIENTSFDNFSKFTIALAGKLDKSGQEMPMFFEELGLSNPDDQIPYSVLVEKLQSELYISQDDALLICQRLDTDRKNTLTQAKITNGIIFEQAADDAFSEDWVVTKAEFLSCILNRYEEKRHTIDEWLKRRFNEKDVEENKFLDSDQLVELVQSIQPDLDYNQIDLEAAQLQSSLSVDDYTYELFNQLAYEFGIGGLSYEAFASTIDTT